MKYLLDIIAIFSLLSLLSSCILHRLVEDTPVEVWVTTNGSLFHESEVEKGREAFVIVRFAEGPVRVEVLGSDGESVSLIVVEKWHPVKRTWRIGLLEIGEYLVTVTYSGGKVKKRSFTIREPKKKSRKKTAES